MIIESARNPVFRNAAGTVVDLLVTFDTLGEVPFSAHANDSEAHGMDLYARAVAGEFGVVTAFVPPSQADLDAISNTLTLANLRELDLASIRSMREYIASKPDAPALLKTTDAAAAVERAKLK